jgi:hypothetical protein
MNNNPNTKHTGRTYISIGEEFRRTIEPINCLLRLILVLVSHERESSGVTSPTAIAMDKHTVQINESTNGKSTPGTYTKALPNPILHTTQPAYTSHTGQHPNRRMKQP